MTKEEKEHLDFLKSVEEENTRMFENMVPHMANNYNPLYKDAVKGTPLENLDNTGKDKLMKSLLELYGNRYHAFRDAWVDLFGSSKATPFKETPKVVLDEFMNDAMNAKKIAFKKDYAFKWLSNKYTREMNLVRDRNLRV